MKLTNVAREALARRLYNWSLRLTVVDAYEDDGISREVCEMYLVESCEIYCDCVKLKDGRACCSECAMVVPDMLEITPADIANEPTWGCPLVPNNPILDGAVTLLGRALGHETNTHPGSNLHTLDCPGVGHPREANDICSGCASWEGF